MQQGNSAQYPLTVENLGALLDYYFSFLPGGDIDQLFAEIKHLGISLEDLEYASVKILPFVSLVQGKIGGVLTQTNILSYGIETFVICHNESVLAPERYHIIKAIQSISGMDERYEEMQGKESRLFILNFWN